MLRAAGRSRPKSQDRTSVCVVCICSGATTIASTRMPGTKTSSGFSAARFGEPLDLGDDDAAIVAHAERLIERAEIAAFMFIGKIAALVGGRRADDRDIGNDRRKEQPVLAGESDARDDRASPPPWRSSRSPARAGSANVSMPILVSTPGRLAAASRCMSNRMPEGTL